MSLQALPAPATKLFRYLFEQASLGIAVEDLDGHLLLANPALCSMLGYTEKELCSMSCSEFANEEDSQDDWALFQQLRAGLIDRYSLEKRYIRKDRTHIWGRLNVSLLREQDGSAIVFAFVEEITQRKQADEALRESETRERIRAKELETILDAVPLPMRIAHDINCLRMTGNRAAYEQARIPVGGNLSKSSPSNTPARFRLMKDGVEVPAAMLPMQQAARTGEPVHGRALTIVYEDGTKRETVQNAAPLLDDKGKPRGAVGTSFDLTELKIAEEKLRASETRFRLAAEAGKMFAYEWDAATDVVVRTEEHASVLGFGDQGEITRQQLAGRVHPGDRAAFLGTADEVSSQNPTVHINYRMLRPDGSVVWLGKSARAFFDEQGKLLRMVGMVADITARKNAEESLRESEERFRLAVRAGNMFAYEWDAATDAVVRSQEYARILGSDDLSTGQQIMAKVHPDDRDALLAATDALTPDKPDLRVSYRMIRADGSVIWLERTSRAHFDEQGKMLRIVGMAADVTERKRAEEALSSMSRRLIEAQEQERVRIARELHDDLGQRLALLANELQQVEQSFPDLHHEVSSRIRELQQNTFQIATDIQSLSHELHSSKLEYLGLAGAMRSFCHEFGGQQKVKIDFGSQDIPGALPSEVTICLFRVLQEALRNSVKHSGVPEVEVRLWGISNEIHLAVKDSGAGFDKVAAKQSRGLGLISMEERLKLVKGTFLIETQPLRGTRIHARVPIQTESDSLRATG